MLNEYCSKIQFPSLSKFYREYNSNSKKMCTWQSKIHLMHGNINYAETANACIHFNVNYSLIVPKVDI